jgi:hypothetical protein
MEWLTSTFAVILGLLLRLAVPILFTILVGLFLKLLDERWKKDRGGIQVLSGLAKNIGCWEINQCPEEQRAGCTAFTHPDVPCWQVFRTGDGRLQERCLACEIFRRSPVPVTS